MEGEAIEMLFSSYKENKDDRDREGRLSGESQGREYKFNNLFLFSLRFYRYLAIKIVHCTYATFMKY